MNNLNIENIEKVFGKKVVNNNLSMCLKPGEIVALIGHNGAGKTTLLNQIVGITKPNSGDIKFNGISFPENDKIARENVNMMPQFHAPLEGVTLRQAITSILSIRGFKSKLVKDEVDAIIKDLELEEFQNVSGEKLSGGLQRITSFAMTIAKPAPILLFDEPTNDVDPVRRKMIWKYMRKLANENHIVLVVTHNLLEVEQFSDRYILLDHGNLIEEKSTKIIDVKNSQHILMCNICNRDILNNLPSNCEFEFIEEEEKILLTFSIKELRKIIEWIEFNIYEGFIKNYKISSLSLDEIYGGLLDEK